MSHPVNTEIMESLAEEHSEKCSCRCCIEQESMCPDCSQKVQDMFDDLGDPDNYYDDYIE